LHKHIQNEQNNQATAISVFLEQDEQRRRRRFVVVVRMMLMLMRGPVHRGHR